jgi:PhnB protein
MAKAIPEGYPTLSINLVVDDAAKAIEFYKRAFGAKERLIMPAPNGKIGHAELEIGGSVIMLADPFPQSQLKSPKETGAATAGIFMYAEDVDEVIRQAVDAGATVTMEPENMFWGDRFGSVADPFGHVWQIATHVEDVPPDEMEERSKKAMAEMMSSS